MMFRNYRAKVQLRELENARIQDELKYLRAQVNPHFFMNMLNNVHRSYVVNMNHVLEIEKSMLKMRNGATISLGGNYKDEFMLHVKQHLVLK